MVVRHKRLSQTTHSRAGARSHQQTIGVFDSVGGCPCGRMVVRHKRLSQTTHSRAGARYHIGFSLIGEDRLLMPTTSPGFLLARFYNGNA